MSLRSWGRGDNERLHTAMQLAVGALVLRVLAAAYLMGCVATSGMPRLCVGGLLWRHFANDDGGQCGLRM